MLSRTALVVVPLIVAVVIAIGLRTGAGDGALAAIVYGAPRAKNGSATWQIHTFRDFLTSRETAQVPLHVTIGDRAIDTTSNVDGVAEIEVPANVLRMDVRSGDDVLASGALRVEEVRWQNDEGIAYLKPSRTSGPLSIRVAPWGGRLTSGFPGTITLKVEGATPPEIELDAQGEESASVESQPLPLCSSGMTTLAVLPLLQAAGLTVHAKTKSGLRGEWFGALPIAQGGMQLTTTDIDAHTTVTAPGNAAHAYVEIDDDQGRAWAGLLDLAPDATDPRPHAKLAMPPGLLGDLWIVVSPDPRGAETIASSTIARRAHVGPDALNRCEAALRLAPSARGFPRFVALDGIGERRAMLARRRVKGRIIALSGLASGGLLELFLIMRASRDAKRGLESVQKKSRAGFLEFLIAVSVALLGFAILGAFITWLG